MVKSFYSNSGPFALAEFVERLRLQVYRNGQEVALDPELAVTDIATLDNATRTEISFYANAKYADKYANFCGLACVTLEANLAKAPQDAYILVSKNPNADFAKITAAFYPEESHKAGIHNTAVIDPESFIGQDCEIGANVVICGGVKIGNGCKIYPGAYIGKKVQIGDNSVIHHNVTISNAIIGNNAIIHAGARIGQDGFGYAFDNFVHLKVPQIGRVLIGSDVEIGANSTIDRGAINDTIIGDMCKIDNLVQIGHNVKLGRGCIIVSQVGISGSTEIGDFSVLGGQAGIAGHLKIGKAVQVAAQSGVVSDVEDRAVLGGTPAVPIRQWHRQSVILKKLTRAKND